MRPHEGPPSLIIGIPHHDEAEEHEHDDGHDGHEGQHAAVREFAEALGLKISKEDEERACEALAAFLDLRESPEEDEGVEEDGEPDGMGDEEHD